MKTKKVSSPISDKRETNLELYRIIMMLLIVMHHYVVNSGLLSEGGPIYSDIGAKRSILLLLLGTWGKSAINGFLLMTGFFMCNKNLTAKKYAMLLGETMFYKIVINAVFFCTGREAVTKGSVLSALLPVKTVNDSVSQIVLVFLLFIPFLNVLINNLTEKNHLRLLGLSLFVYVFLGSFAFLGVRMNYLSWFIVLYLTGSYFGRYRKKVFERRKLWGYLMLFSLGVSLATVINGINKGSNALLYLNEVNKLLPFTNGLTTFMFFKSVKLPYNRIINYIAASTYGVFLIHTSGDAMRQFLWKDLLRVTKAYYLSWPLLLLHIFGSVLGVYAVCTLIDILRRKFVEKPLFGLWDKYFPAFKEKYGIFEDRVCKRLNISQ
ncbi:MAG: hypothetical protein IJS90_07480 [Clostridia bacterium]|nr:hypothetical protein [Clostridia bacterium]